MSLVNDMLNDLEQRRGQQDNAVVDLDWIASEKKEPRSKLFYWLFLLLIIMGTLIGVAVISKMYFSASAIDDSINIIDKATSQNVKPVPDIKDDIKAVVQSVGFSQQGNKVVMHFSYTKAVEYEVLRVSSGLRIEFLSAGHQLDIEQLQTPNPIRSLSVDKRSDSVLVVIGIAGEFTYSSSASEASGLKLLIQPLPIAMAKNTSQQGIVVEEFAKKSSIDVATTKITPAINKPISKILVDNNSQELAKDLVGKVETNTPSAGFAKTLAVDSDLEDKQRAKSAQRLVAQGAQGKAEDQLQLFLQDYPFAVHSGEVMAALLVTQQRYQEAEQLINRLRSRHEHHINLRAIHARLSLLSGNAKESVDLLMGARPKVHSHKAYYELLGLAARQNQQYLLSEQVYKGLLDVDANQGDWWVGMAVALDAQGQVIKARAAYQQALQAVRISAPLKSYAKQRLAN